MPNCVRRRLQLYIHHLDGQYMYSWYGVTGRGGVTASVRPTRTRLDHIYMYLYLAIAISPIKLLVKWMLHVSVSSWFRQVQIWIPKSGWSLRMTECQPTEIRPFLLPHMYRAYASQPPPPLSTSWNRYKSHLKATIKADISRPEKYRHNEAKALGIPLDEFEHNNCSDWSSAQKHRHCDCS